MSETKEHARQKVAELVEKFRQTPERDRLNFTEQELRLYFILPLFEALGWNIHEANEVSAEEQISLGRVDFGFYQRGVPVFYLETKRYGEDLNRFEWIKQAMDYAYNSGITWAVLCNFAGLKAMNAQIMERIYAQATFLDLQWERYAEADFDDLWLFSKEAIAKGDLDRLAERFGKKAKKKPVTELLFAQFTVWRRDLFKHMREFGNLFKEDPRQLDDAIQKLFDRLIFIRSMEDRKVEKGHLRAVLHQYKESRKKDKNLFKELLKLFREMDKLYNARLFAPSHLDLLEVHDVNLLTSIIDGLYTAPGGFNEYDFNAISADVLGSMYEQYLSFKALDPAGKKAIEPLNGKEVKRKEQGIFYTPTFVVRYIVQQTLGKLLQEGADPYKIRVLDPACGSGSFLIEAFDVLDRWIAQYGTADDKAHPRVRRLRILQENIFGVDLDPQAVEVAQLNLLLRAAYERGRLPMLENIRVGNSLVDDPEVAGEVAFNWEEQFPQIMAAGGFDVVIGNPPYVRQELLGDLFKEYAQDHFQTYFGTADLYVYFVEQAHRLLGEDGYFGMITSNKFIRANYGRNLREFLAKRARLLALIDFGELPVFREAATFPAILITQKRIVERQQFVHAAIKRLEFESLEEEVNAVGTLLDERSLNGSGWTLAQSSELAIMEKMRNVSVPLRSYVNNQVYRGIITGYNKAFVIDKPTRNRLIAEDAKSAEIIKPFVVGDDVRKYRINFQEQYLIFARRGIQIEDYPAIKRYLEQFKERLLPKPRDWQGNEWTGRKPGDYQWYEIQDPVDYFAEFEKPKIVYPDIAKESRAAFDASGLYLANTIYFIPSDDLYLLGLLNSKLIFTYYKRIAAVLGDADQGGRLRWFRQDVEKLPIRPINFDDPADTARHTRMVQLVQRIIALTQRHAETEAVLDDRRHDLARQIRELDAQIDALVYDLYGLTEAEITVIEGAE